MILVYDQLLVKIGGFLVAAICSFNNSNNMMILLELF